MSSYWKSLTHHTVNSTTPLWGQMLPTIIGLTSRTNFQGKRQAILEERPEYEICRKMHYDKQKA